MIKKYLLGFFVFLVGFIGFFVNGTYTQGMTIKNAGGYLESPFDSSVNVAVYSRGMFGSNQIGYTKRMYVYTNKTNDKAYIFWNNNRLYMYYYYYNDHVMFQGYSTSYAICDPFSLGDTVVNNCQTNSISSSSVNIITNFMNSFKSTDLYGVSKGYYTVYVRTYYLTMCFNSSEFDKSLCFSSSDGLNGSLNLSENLSFTDVGNDLLQDPPGWNTSGGGNVTGNVEGGSQEISNSDLTGDVQYTVCTKEKALNYYKIKGYTSKLCYSSYSNNTDIYNGSSSVSNYSLQGTDIKDVWSDTYNYRSYGRTGSILNYSDWLDYWRNMYYNYQNSYEGSGNTVNPFKGVPVSIFTLMGNLNSYGNAYNNQGIIEYCNLEVYTQDLNSVYSGILGTIPCNYSAIDLVGDQFGVHAESGQVVQGSSWEGILNRSGYSLEDTRNTGNITSGSSSGLTTYTDGSQFMNDTFNEIQSRFRFPDNIGIIGIIPNYILVFMVALILFRFLSH